MEGSPDSPLPVESFSLRKATEDDIPTILEIERKCHKAPWGEDNLRAELEKPYSHFLVLTDDQTDSAIAGYIVFWTMFEEGHILNVVVDLPFRGLGFAKRMVRHAVQISLQKGAKRLLLEVRKSNVAALELYQRLGFVITHVRKSFYSDGEDAYEMALFVEDQGVRF